MAIGVPSLEAYSTCSMAKADASGAPGRSVRRRIAPSVRSSRQSPAGRVNDVKPTTAVAAPGATARLPSEPTSGRASSPTTAPSGEWRGGGAGARGAGGGGEPGAGGRPAGGTGGGAGGGARRTGG